MPCLGLTQLDTATQTLYADTWYDMHVVTEGTDVTVSLGPKGGMMGSLFSASTSLATGATFDIRAEQTDCYKFDDVSLTTTGGGFATSTTLAYNTGNELTSMTTNGVATNFAYDAWSRQTQKTQGSYSATYAYAYGGKLRSVTSNFPNEGTVTYQYGGDGKRRERVAGSVTTRYKWDVVAAICETDSSNVLQRSFIGDLAEAVGANPSSGTWRFYTRDNIGSTRGLFDQAKASIGTYDYTPYGSPFSESGQAITHKFTGHEWDSVSGMYLTMYRAYIPTQARWLTKDPMGMVDGPNMYAYGADEPITAIDVFGLWNAQGHGCYADFDTTHNPLNLAYTWMHFMDLPGSLGLVADAISSCDGQGFLDAMHMMQDYFAHYGMGYRWYKVGHIPEYFGYRNTEADFDDPDYNRSQYDQAMKWTRRLENAYKKKCGNNPCEDKLCNDAADREVPPSGPMDPGGWPPDL